MNNEKTDESGLRRKLFKFFDRSKSIKQILKLIPRSRSWIYKWKERYERKGMVAARGESRTPLCSPQAYPKRVVRIVLSLRKRLQKDVVGLIGAKAIRRELKRRRLVKQIQEHLDYQSHSASQRFD